MAPPELTHTFGRTVTFTPVGRMVSRSSTARPHDRNREASASEQFSVARRYALIERCPSAAGNPRPSAVATAAASSASIEFDLADPLVERSVGHLPQRRHHSIEHGLTI